MENRRACVVGWWRAIVLVGFALGLARPASAQVVISGTVTTSSGEGEATTGDASAAVVPPVAPAPVPALVPEPIVEPATLGPPSRLFGGGTAFGGGGAAAGAYSPGFSASTGVVFAPAIELPTLELLFFVDDHLSVDVSIPLWNTIVIGAFSNGLFLWGTNLFLDFSLGDDWVRFLIGPELGFSYAQVSYGSTFYSATSLAVGALVGLELLSRGRLFGFRVMTRPNVQFAFTSSSDAFAVGGTAMIELALVSYLTDG